MSPLTLDDLRRLLREAGGDDLTGALEGAIHDETFGDLGYDSLAVLELSGLLQRERGVEIPDEMLSGLRTPRQLLDFVNSGHALR